MGCLTSPLLYVSTSWPCPMWPAGWRQQFFNSIHSLSQLGVRALYKGVRNQVCLAQAFRGKSGPGLRASTWRWHTKASLAPFKVPERCFWPCECGLGPPWPLLWFLRGFAGDTGGKPEWISIDLLKPDHVDIREPLQLAQPPTLGYLLWLLDLHQALSLVLIQLWPTL